MALVECCCGVIESYMTGRAHQHGHIIIPLSDNLYLKCDKKDYWLDTKKIAFVAPNIFHRVICTEKIIYFNIPSEMIRDSDMMILHLDPIFEVHTELEPLISLIHAEAVRNVGSDDMRYLFYFLYSKMVSRNKFKSIQYIEDHYSMQIDIGDLATLEEYSTAYYSVWFKQRMGLSPQGYIKSYRIEKAKEFLVNTTYQVSKIAYQVGYTDASSFARAFKAVVGITPQRYRTENRYMNEYSKLPYWKD